MIMFLVVVWTAGSVKVISVRANLEHEVLSMKFFPGKDSFKRAVDEAVGS